MSGAVRRVRQKSEKQKISSLATQGVQAGPDNDDIKQKDKVKMSGWPGHTRPH